MAGLAAIFGGALSGLGKGIAQQGEMDWNERKERAMAALRAQQDADRDERGQTNDIAKIEKTGEVQGKLQRDNDIRQGELQAEQDARRTKAQEIIADKQFNQQITLKSIDAKNERSLTLLRGSIAERQDAAGVKLRADIESGDVKDIKEGSDGFYHGVRKNGDSFNLNIGVPVKADEGSGGTIAAARAARGGAAPVPASRPPAQQKPAAGSGNTFTMAEAQATAKARGMPVDSVVRIMKQQGFKLAAS